MLAVAAGRAAATLELRVASLILGCVIALCWIAQVYVERSRALSDRAAMMTDSSDGQEGQ